MSCCRKMISAENEEEKTMEYIQYEITEQNLEAYKHNMMENEKSPATIEKYLRDVRSFCRWNQGEVIARTRILEWKITLPGNMQSVLRILCWQH